MVGYMGYSLEVDLTKGKSKKKKISEEILKKTIGGRGFGIHYLYNEVGPGVDPLSEKNVMIFANGPFSGTAVPSCGLFSMTTKSPLTGTCLSAHSGGYFGAKLKYSGYDALIIKGAAKEPCYILIDGNTVKIESAKDLWGTDTVETVDCLKKRHGDVSVVAIGQAGENGVLISALMTDAGRAAARGGPGAVMGSKKLKAIVVKGGMESVKIADKQLFESIFKKSNTLIAERSVGMRENGTTGVVMMGNAAGILPTRNFQTSYFDKAEDISSESLKKYKVSDRACFGCSIICSKVHKVGEGDLEGPDYETLFALGSNCGNSSIESVLRQNDLCNRYGIDTISAGLTMSFAMELYEKGIIDKNDTGGLELTWGNTDAQEELLKKIAFREGIGDILADGTRKAASTIGKDAKRYAIHVKGMEFPGYDPRGVYGMALAYATSSRGACHLRAMMHVVEVFQGKLDRFSFDGKGQAVKDIQDELSVVDSLIMCKFAFRHGFDSSAEKIAEMIKAVTGWDVDGEWVRLTGERIYNLERLFNLEAGIGSEQDCLPDRFFNEKIPDGPCKGRSIDYQLFQNCMKDYYTVRGWDENGVPTSAKLKELGIF